MESCRHWRGESGRRQSRQTATTLLNVSRNWYGTPSARDRHRVFLGDALIPLMLSTNCIGSYDPLHWLVQTCFYLYFVPLVSALCQLGTISGIDPWLFIPFQVSGIGFREREGSKGAAGDLEICLAFAYWGVQMLNGKLDILQENKLHLLAGIRYNFQIVNSF